MLPVHCVDGGGLAEHDWAGEQTWGAKGRRSSSLAAETPNRFLLLSKASRLISTHPGPPTNAQNPSKPLERANSSIEFDLGPSSSRSNELELELTNFRTIELVRPFPGLKPSSLLPPQPLCPNSMGFMKLRPTKIFVRVWYDFASGG